MLHNVQNMNGANLYLFPGERLMHMIKKTKLFRLTNNSCYAIKYMGKNMTYGEYIKLLNYMTIDDDGRYAEWKDNF